MPRRPIDYLSNIDMKLVFAISSNRLGSAMRTTRKTYLGLAATCALAIAPFATAQQAAKVTVTVNNVANASGTIRGSLCPDPDVFAKTTCPDAFNASAPAAAGAV